jgi:hypothetical protein
LFDQFGAKYSRAIHLHDHCGGIGGVFTEDDEFQFGYRALATKSHIANTDALDANGAG